MFYIYLQLMQNLLFLKMILVVATSFIARFLFVFPNWEFR